MAKEKDKISCKDVENFLQPYLEDRLNNRDCYLLLNHLKGCEECMDELEIRYLLHEGLKRLEDGHDFNLKSELEERLYHSEQHILMIDRIKTTLILFGAALVILGLVQLVFVMIG